MVFEELAVELHLWIDGAFAGEMLVHNHNLLAPPVEATHTLHVVAP
ncbi:MAG: hypothetical protein ABMB14_02035 [Myxococcota bacterium]